MHELAITEALVEGVEEQIAAGRITKVRIEIGRDVAVVGDALQFCFEACVRGTRLEGATLVIEERDGGALRVVEVTVQED
jgi:hydrogenase nickel incorporation protein HypA/HybF